MQKYQGIFPAFYACYDENGHISPDGVRAFTRFLMDKGVHESAAIMHGGTIMTLLATCALPRRHLAEWATDNGRGYTILVDPSIYGRTGAVEVIDII